MVPGQFAGKNIWAKLFQAQPAVGLVGVSISPIELSADLTDLRTARLWASRKKATTLGFMANPHPVLEGSVRRELWRGKQGHQEQVRQVTWHRFSLAAWLLVKAAQIRCTKMPTRAGLCESACLRFYGGNPKKHPLQRRFPPGFGDKLVLSVFGSLHLPVPSILPRRTPMGTATESLTCCIGEPMACCARTHKRET